MILLVALLVPASIRAAVADTSDLFADIETLASYGDRSTGGPGARAAASHIRKRFQELGFSRIGSHLFSIPVLAHENSELRVSAGNGTSEIFPLLYNAISPGTVGPAGLEGPLLYVGAGELHRFNGKRVAGSIILMEMDSGKNWLNAAAIGARALILVDRGESRRFQFTEKQELSPLDFPVFWMPLQTARDVFGRFEDAPGGRVDKHVRLTSNISWKPVRAENIYCVIPGTDEKLEDELLIVEAFYDSRALVAGRSPGADEACGMAALLALGRFLKENPPKRPVMLLATAGHAQSLAGMREIIWSLRSSPRDLKKTGTRLKEVLETTERHIRALDGFSPDRLGDPEYDAGLLDAVVERIKTEVDHVSQDLMRLRLLEDTAANREEINKLAHYRLVLRRLIWRSDFAGLAKEELDLLSAMMPAAKVDLDRALQGVKSQLELLRSATAFRRKVGGKDITAFVSLHLSSHGNGVGAFNRGWLYELKPEINPVAAYSRLEEELSRAAGVVQREPGLSGLFHDTLRPSRLRSWESYFGDRPPLGGEVGAMAGYLAITLATVHDARPLWGTPHDLPANVDRDYAQRQAALVCGLIGHLAASPRLDTGRELKNGFSSVVGRANFIRHGELFADQPAPGTVILAYQGPAVYHAQVNEMGLFHLKGMADNTHSVHKVIIEGYRFDPKTGRVLWAIDKKQTGKEAYRVRMRRRTMETDLVMFACRQTTIFNLLEPRSFNYMTRLDLIDGRLEAPPLKSWWSRIDTRSSVISSLYLEPGTWLKLTLTDSLLNKKLILLNATREKSHGTGYLVDQWPAIHLTELRVARDMWTLLGPRIANLERHGIFNEKIRDLRKAGEASLTEAEQALKDLQYDRALNAALTSWALATRVYSHVETTQRDVLFGVLFYIALFVPFAFCMERLLFSYADIHKRILAFLGILLVLIGVIYKVHPAFELAYSPTVVILAFFIMGLSLIVTLIIFFRFEEEMVRLQKRAGHMNTSEISRWQAFVASFFLGISNLRRRRLRTVLTCATLIILTFTIMSFTSVKSLRHRASIRYQDRAGYRGFLLKNFNWRDLPPEAYAGLSNAFRHKGTVLPRVWWEDEDNTRAALVALRHGDKSVEARGMVGLDAREARVRGLNRILVHGRWFNQKERRVVILPERMARNLGVDENSLPATVLVWGMPYQVVGIFSSQKYAETVDLDGEPMTPVTFPGEMARVITDVELEAMETGDDVRAFQSRYQHVAPDLTVVVPARTLLAAGGRLKAVSLHPAADLNINAEADRLVDRFKLTMFMGTHDGTYLYQASDSLSYSGVPNILIPILISVFIVLNTMIGSVYERKREIAIYTSVGLAPSHVSFLFIAEALAFAVLSVVLGYLVAQGAAGLFAGTALWSGITVNYSSLAGVAAMVLIFLVVLVSVIYPSRVAARIAIPDVNRAWTLPQARGNTLELSLPILMQYKETQGIGGFMLSFFEAHRDVSHGLFSTDRIETSFACPLLPEWAIKDLMARPDCRFQQGCVQFQSTVWLAPFDFGIMQRVELEFLPSEEEPGYLEIRVRLTRLAGEANAWHRINKAFLNQMRKQVLVWRSLTDEAKHYFEDRLLSRERR